MVHSYSRIDTTAAWKKLGFILSDKFDFHMIDNLLIAVYAYTSYILTSFSVDEMLLPRYECLSTIFSCKIYKLELHRHMSMVVDDCQFPAYVTKIVLSILYL